MIGQKEVTGYFKKYRASFSIYDDGEKITAQIIKKSKYYTIQKLRKYYENNLLEVYSSLGEIFYDYHVKYIWYETENIITIYYDYRIEKYPERECHKIIFESKDINVFGQNREFLNGLYEGIDNNNIDFKKFEFEKNVIIRDKDYKLVIKNSIDSPFALDYIPSFSTRFSLECIEAITELEIINIIKYVKVFISFCAKRKNIYLKRIELISKNDDEIGEAFPYGNVYVYNNQQEHQFGKFVDNQMIKVDSIFDKIDKCFEMIDKNYLTMDFIPNETDSLISQYVNITAWIQSFFRTYAKTNSDYIVKNIDILYANKLTKKGNNQKVSLNDIISIIIGYTKEILNEDYIKKCRGILNYFSYYDWINDFSKRITTIRNDICHGHIEKNVSDYKFFVLDLKMVSVYLYAAILKFMEVSEENIKKGINQLFNRQDY